MKNIEWIRGYMEGEKLFSRSAEREMILGVSLLLSFSLCAFAVKEKSG